MFPVRADLTFWRSKQRNPEWTKRIATTGRPQLDDLASRETIDIDGVVNAHAGLRGDRLDKNYEKHNLMSVIRMRRRTSGESAAVELLEQIESSAPKNRSAVARRWLRKIVREE